MELAESVKAMNPDTGTENRTFRYLYGFAILFVVLSHCDGGGFEMLSNWMHFGAFHLAIFVFGSGYFFKPESAKTPLRYGVKKICKLLIPLWIFHFVYGLILIGLHKFGFAFGDEVNLRTLLLNPIYSKDLYTLNMGSWFVFPFFMVQMLYMIGKGILNGIKKEKVTDFVWQLLLFAGAVFCVYLASKGFQFKGSSVLFRIAYFMPFYILGIWYRSFFEKYLEKIPATWILSVCLIASLLMNAYFGRVVYAIPSSCDYPFGVVATYMSAVIGLVFWLTVARELSKCRAVISALHLLGTHTWDIMFHQFMGILIVKCIFVACNQLFGIFPDFDYGAFYTDIWYLYLPRGLAEFKALYVVFAIAFSILAGKLAAVVKMLAFELCKLGRVVNRDGKQISRL